MSNFENRVKEASENAVIKIISEGGWVMPSYENRVKIPKEFMQEVWNLIDTEKVKKILAEKLEEQVVEKLVVMFATEISNDIRMTLSNKEIRDKIRQVALDNLSSILEK